MMERPDIEQIQERAEKATEGPWEAKCSGHDYPYIEACGWQLACGEDFAKMPDATFIAHARQDIPALCRYALDLEAQVEQLRAALEDESTDYNSGLLNDYGGGIVSWWHDYIRYEVGCCNQIWRDRVDSLAALAQTPAQAGERTQKLERLYEAVSQIPIRYDPTEPSAAVDAMFAALAALDAKEG